MTTHLVSSIMKARHKGFVEGEQKPTEAITILQKLESSSRTQLSRST